MYLPRGSPFLRLTPSSEDKNQACGTSEALFTRPANYAQPFSSRLGVKDPQDNELRLRAPDNAGHLMCLNTAARAFLFPSQSVELQGPGCVPQLFTIDNKEEFDVCALNT